MSNKVKYYKLILPISGEDEQENAIGILNYISNFESVEQQNEQLLVSYKIDNQPKESLAESLNELQLCVDWQIEDEPEINWNERYEKSFQPLIILDNQWGVRATFHEKLDTKHEIIIDPKMSFGTGHHETTKQMMEMMTKLNFTDKSVWDYGSGTGILAIMAEMLGASRILANDNEEWAYNNSLENAELNACDKVKFAFGTAENCIETGFLNPTTDKFDIIIANITKNILLDSALIIDQFSQSGTHLLLSGFYQDDISDIEKKYNSINFSLQSQSVLNRWTCLSFIKN